MKPELITYNVLVDLLCKGGDLRQAMSPDLITYNVLVGGLCNAGELRQARSLVAEMNAKGLNLHRITYSSLNYGFC